MADGYEEASPQLKLDIATYFILSSPTGEVDQVVAGNPIFIALL